MPSLPISVIIPALNAEFFLEEAIASVNAQTVQVAEIIVVDNGSIDRTKEIAQRLGAKVLERNDRSGPSAARNEGIRNSNQEWVALLDADDRWDCQKLEWQWSSIKRFPEAGFVSCYIRVFENLSILFEQTREEMAPAWNAYTGECRGDGDYLFFPRVEKHFFPNFQPAPSSVMIRRDVFQRAGLFDEEIEYCEDLEFFLRVLADSPLLIVEKILVDYRRHEGKMSFQLEEMRRYLFTVVNKFLAQPDKYAPGVGEVYRDILKKNFFLAEKTLSERLHAVPLGTRFS